MKNYDNYNYSRYKADIKANMPEDKFWDEYTRDELITKFLPLVENIARKFSTSDSAIGVMNITDLIAMGHVGLIQAVDKIQWKQIFDSKDPERTLKSYLAKRIRGAIRRSVDGNRAGMRLPEHKLNEIRKNFDEDNSLLFFNSMFESIDQQLDDENSYLYQIEDKSEDPYLHSKLHNMLRNVMLKVLTDREYHVIRLSYGINCDKQSAKQIANYLNMDGVSSYVRVSQLKKQAINKLKNSLTYSQVADYL